MNILWMNTLVAASSAWFLQTPISYDSNLEVITSEVVQYLEGENETASLRVMRVSLIKSVERQIKWCHLFLALPECEVAIFLPTTSQTNQQQTQVQHQNFHCKFTEVKNRKKQVFYRF